MFCEGTRVRVLMLLLFVWEYCQISTGFGLQKSYTKLIQLSIQFKYVNKKNKKTVSSDDKLRPIVY